MAEPKGKLRFLWCQRLRKGKPEYEPTWGSPGFAPNTDTSWNVWVLQPIKDTFYPPADSFQHFFKSASGRLQEIFKVIASGGNGFPSDEEIELSNENLENTKLL